MAGPESAEALRRRLYAPGATADDVARYRAVAAPEPDGPPPAPEPQRPRRRRRTVVLAAGAGLLVAGVAAGGVLADRADPVARPTASARSTTPPSPGSLDVPAPERRAFVRALRAGQDAGIGRYLYTEPDARPADIRTVTRADSEERHGTGARTVELRPSTLADRGGRLTVVLVLDRAARYAWQATRPAPANDRSGPAEPVAARVGALAAGQAATATIPYPRPAPTRLVVLVPPDVRWGLLAVFTD